MPPDDAGPITLPYRPEWQTFLPLAATGTGVLGVLAWFGDAGVGPVLICLGATAALIGLARTEVSRALLLDEDGIAFSSGGTVQRAPWNQISDVRFSRFIPSRRGPGHHAPLPIVEELLGEVEAGEGPLGGGQRLPSVGAVATHGVNAVVGHAIHALVVEADDNWEVRITVRGGATKRLRGVHFEQPGDALLTLAGAVALRWPGAGAER